MKATCPISPISRASISQCSKVHSRQRPHRRWRTNASRKKSAGGGGAGRRGANVGKWGDGGGGKVKNAKRASAPAPTRRKPRRWSSRASKGTQRRVGALHQ